jgi:hypothetical protein
MINYSRTERFHLDSRNLFLATASSFEREATRISRELRASLNESVIRMAVS